MNKILSTKERIFISQKQLIHLGIALIVAQFQQNFTYQLE